MTRVARATSSGIFILHQQEMHRPLNFDFNNRDTPFSSLNIL